MTNKEFRSYAHQLVDWMADYFENVEQYPVKPDVLPGDIKKQLPEEAPNNGESFEDIFSDFQKIVMPGITHWQHPKFFAYFPSSRSAPSVLAEMLTATLGAQCMIWYTSPAAEEMEERMMEWLRQMLGLPDSFVGAIHETASAATLVALLVAREKKTDYKINQSGNYDQKKLRVYASEHIHSSIDKAVKIAGFGIDNLVKISADKQLALVPEELEEAIKKDLTAGFLPTTVVVGMGTTSSTAIDPLEEIGKICEKYNVWLHVDAAYAGTALLLPEMRWMSKGIERADSFVFNPHKWMFTNFDCSVFYVKDKKALINTFSILPEYLKTPADKLVNNYRDWGIQLGRRFRALKLWFVIRSYGINGLQEKIRKHIEIGQWLAKEIENTSDFELLAPVPLNLVCFRYKPAASFSEPELNNMNERLLNQLNDSGKTLLTQTKLNGKYTIRLVAGQVETKLEDVQEGWEMIKIAARSLA